MCEEFYERFGNIESALKELGLEQCVQCGMWKKYLKNVDIKIGIYIINKDICSDCENALKWDIV